MPTTARSTLRAVVLLVLATPCVARADVLCRKKSGAVFSRPACKAKETSLGPVENVLQGPQGPPGPRGPQGLEGPRGADGPPGASVDMSLLPIALGHMDVTGELSYAKNVGTPTFNATTGQYEIPILDPGGAPIFYYYEDFATVVSSDADLTAVATSNQGKLVVRLVDKDGAKVQGAFQFVVFRLHTP